MDNDDIREFNEIAENFQSSVEKLANMGIANKTEDAPTPVDPQTTKAENSNMPTQWALYGGGYTATTPTVKSMPAGCYDIWSDPKCIYAAPALPPSGLLLELPEMRSEDVIRLVDIFWNSEKDYKDGNEFVIGGAAYKAGIMLYGPPGCHAIGTRILMFDGTTKCVEDIKVGELLMGPDSRSRTVLELRSGVEKMVRITPTKGSSFVINMSHILHLTPSGNSDTGIRHPINVKFSNYVNNTECFKERLKLTRTGVEFTTKDLPIDPYILGSWLGDGTSREVAITSMDKEILDYWEEYGKNNDLGINITAISGKAMTIQITSGMSEIGDIKKGRNKVRTAFQELELLNNKHIPLLYKTSDRGQRLALLAGILDTDGSLDGTFDYSSKTKILAEDVVYLARSLGLAAYMVPMRKECVNNGVWGDYYRVSISGDISVIPNKLARKKALPRKQIKNVLRTGFSYELLPEDEFYGFTLSGDHLYLTDDFIIHHNSGKSCTIKIVSNKLVQRNGIVFYASGNPGRIQQFLSDFARIERDRKSIVILEDIDSLINSHGEDRYLEMLDSAKIIDNVLFIATTNYPERLDPRIYNRPGRFSHVIKIGLPGPKAREAYLKAILKNHRDVEYIVDHSSGFTIDHLTALVNATYREKKNLTDEIERLRLLFKIPKADDKAPIGIGRE